MPTIATTLRTFADALACVTTTAEARALARRVLSQRLKLDAHELALRGTEEVAASTLPLLANDLCRLLAHEPVQYVVGEAPFLELDIVVGPGVLIPRPETEELAQLVIARLKEVAAPRVLDVGTGSGCLAVAVAHYVPTAEVTGLDVSAEALAIARQNGLRYGNKVRWIEADIFGEPLRDLHGLDAIVSNPPYVPQREAATLQPQVRDHEPALALFVPDHDPLIYYRRLAEVGSLTFSNGGQLFLETHTAYAQAVADVLLRMGYSSVGVGNDFTGRPRFVTAEWRSR